MRRKQRYIARLRNAVWIERGQWTPTYVLDQQHGVGNEYQHFGLDANGKLVFAGVTRHENVNQHTAKAIHRVWRRWRNEYDNVFTGKGQEYPGRHCPTVTRIVIHPIADHTASQSFAV